MFEFIFHNDYSGESIELAPIKQYSESIEMAAIRALDEAVNTTIRQFNEACEAVCYEQK